MEPDGLAFSARVTGDVSSTLASALFRGEAVDEGPVLFERATGRAPRDLIRGSFSSQRLLSKRVDAALRTAGLTGYSPYPVELRVEGRLVDGYVGLGVAGRCGPITIGSNGHQLRTSPAGVRYRAPIGLDFDRASWDGSDLFIPSSGETLVLLSKAAVDALASVGGRNLGWTPIEEYEGSDIEIVK